jgi:hypothetical protein
MGAKFLRERIFGALYCTIQNGMLFCCLNLTQQEKTTTLYNIPLDLCRHRVKRRHPRPTETRKKKEAGDTEDKSNERQ